MTLDLDFDFGFDLDLDFNLDSDLDLDLSFDQHYPPPTTAHYNTYQINDSMEK